MTKTLIIFTSRNQFWWYGARIEQKWQKEVWDGGKTTEGLGTGELQWGPGAEPRYGVWWTISPEAEEFLK